MTPVIWLFGGARLAAPVGCLAGRVEVAWPGLVACAVTALGCAAVLVAMRLVAARVKAAWDALQQRGLGGLGEGDAGDVVVSAVDMAEQARMARDLAEARSQAERANAAKTRFVATVSHELRTPLNGILGYAQLMRLEGGLTALQASRIEAMLSAGSHLLSTINGVLDLSAIESDCVTLTRAPFDLAAMVADCLSIVRPAAAAKGLGLDLIAGDYPRHVVGDRIRLQQILVNLLGNAVKFTAAGGVSLHVLATGDAYLVRFSVTDTGRGIPRDQIARIFRRHERLERDVAGAVEGSGLGLPLAAHLADLMGGSLHHEDRAGGGSVFCLAVPLPRCDLAVAQGHDFSVVQADGVVATGRVARVLVADDVAMNRDVARSFLTTAGHRVVLGASGADAVAAAAGEDFDVILMDIRMPDMDGLEATRRIRGLGGRCARVPIFGLTAQAFLQQIEDCRAAGMDGHLSKPHTVADLLHCVEHGLDLGAYRESLLETGGDMGAPVCVVAPGEPMGWDGAPVILDRARYAMVASSLSAEAMAGHTGATIEAARGLAVMVAADAFAGQDRGRLADAAHALAGSAGLLGLERLCAAGIAFERALRGGGACEAQRAAVVEAIGESVAALAGLEEAFV